MKPVLRIDIVRDRDLDAGRKTLLEQWTQTIFGAEELKHEWATPDWHLLADCDGQLVCHLAVTERHATASGQPVHLAGIGGVMTPPSFRGKGLAGTLMRHAAEFMRDTLRVEFGLLLCSHDLLPLYTRLGWHHVPGPLVFAQTTGNETWEEEVMILPCGDRPWPPGAIDLAGPPW